MDEAGERERDFWDHAVPPLDDAIAAFHAGPDRRDRAMLAAVDIGGPQRVLDFACGAGVTTAWLAAAGHEVTGVDLSSLSVQRARELNDQLGLDASFEVIEIGQPITSPLPFDAMIGRCALHHLDLEVYAPLLAHAVRLGGTAAFIETTATNPVLRVARRHLPGRFGMPKVSSADEHPLTRDDVELLGRAFGEARLEVPEVWILRMVDLYLLRGRRPKLAARLGSWDDRMQRVPWLRQMSYYQMVVCRRVGI